MLSVFSLSNIRFAQLAVATVAAFTLTPPGSAPAMEPVEAGDITITRYYARGVGPAVPVGAAFMTIQNNGVEMDRLLGGGTPAAGRIELHTHIRDGDVVRMRETDTIGLNAGVPTELEPGGLHVMLMELSAPLETGGDIPLTLEFERAGIVELTVPVFPPGAGAEHGYGPATASNGAHDHERHRHGSHGHGSHSHSD